ncbi:MAG: hypothetical protein QOE59_2527 [Actinomycetota bacterium]|jgi:hypothetical protein|nr:hypothetical protein [Actinomycetota bacterium]
MTQAVGVRPGSVTAAQVIIWILAVLGALGAGLMLVVGVIGLVSGVSVAASGAGSEVSGLAGAFGGLISMFSGAIVVGAVISLAFVGLWIWIAVALGRASRAARVVLTVFCALDAVWGLLALVVAAAEQEAAPVLAAVLLLAIPGTLMGLLWGSESARQFFDGVPAMSAPRYAPAPMSPPVGVPRPRMAQPRFPEAATAPLRLPSMRCRTCQSEMRPGWAQCGACGTPVQPPRPVGA